MSPVATMCAHNLSGKAPVVRHVTRLHAPAEQPTPGQTVAGPDATQPPTPCAADATTWAPMDCDADPTLPTAPGACPQPINGAQRTVAAHQRQHRQSNQPGQRKHLAPSQTTVGRLSSRCNRANSSGNDAGLSSPTSSTPPSSYLSKTLKRPWHPMRNRCARPIRARIPPNIHPTHRR